MVLFNHATREMTAKIVYYGPGLCGKTTNLMVIFDKLDPAQKGKMLFRTRICGSISRKAWDPLAIWSGTTRCRRFGS